MRKNNNKNLIDVDNQIDTNVATTKNTNNANKKNVISKFQIIMNKNIEITNQRVIVIKIRIKINKRCEKKTKKSTSIEQKTIKSI